MAHNLPASYNQFIDDFWQNIKQNYKKENYKDILNINESYNGFLGSNTNNYEDFISNLEKHCKDYGYKYEKKDHSSFTDSTRSACIFEFLNSFFFKVNNKKIIENWVDIENLYYF